MASRQPVPAKVKRALLESLPVPRGAATIASRDRGDGRYLVVMLAPGTRLPPQARRDEFNGYHVVYEDRPRAIPYGTR